MAEVLGYVVIAAAGVTITVGQILFMVAVNLYGRYQRKKAERDSRGLAGVSSIDRTVMIRTAIAHRVTLYGQSKISGVITYMLETDDSQNLYVLITLTGHQIKAIYDIYLNDELVEETEQGSNSVAVGKYNGHVEIWRGLGTTAGDADLLSELQTASGGVWSSLHKQSGCAKLLMKLRFNHDIFPGGLPNISCVALGKLLLDPRDSASPTVETYSNNPALAIRDFLMEDDGLQIGIDELNDDEFIASANICDELETLNADNTVDFTMVGIDTPRYAASNGRVWGSILNGDIVPQYAAVELVTGPMTFVYSISFVDASGETTPGAAIDVVQSMPILEGDAATAAEIIPLFVTLNNIPIGPTGTTARKIYRNEELTHTLSDNTTTTYFEQLYEFPAGTYIITDPGTAPPIANTTEPQILRLSAQRYIPTGTVMRVSTAGTLPAPLAINTDYYWIYDRVNEGQLASSLANALAGTAINITTYGTGTHTLVKRSERRYTLDGTATADVAPRDVLRSMLTSCAGELHMPGGLWNLYAGSYRSPDNSLDENSLDGEITTTTRLGSRASFNGVKGVVFSPEDFWQQVDFKPVTNATYLSEDGGQRAWSDIELPFTISKAAAQRIAKIKLEEVRQQIVTRWPCKLSAMRCQIGDTVGLTNERYGWIDKPFKVVDLQLALRTDDDAPRYGVDIVFRETASTIYDWNNGEETVVDPAPNTNLPNPFEVDAPTGVDSETDGYEITNADGAVVLRALVSWNQSTDGYVLKGGRVEIRYARVLAGEDLEASPSIAPELVWQDASPLPGDAVESFISEIEGDRLYYFAVRFVNALGVASEWATVVGAVSSNRKELNRFLLANLTKRTSPKAITLNSVTRGGDDVAFCAVGVADGTDAYIVILPTDSETWAESANPKNFALNAVTWSEPLSRFCAVGAADGTDAYIITSPDGITWTERSNPKNFSLSAVAWSDALSLFCAVGVADGTDAYIITSPDGITWTERSNPNNVSLLEIVWANSLGLFCAVGGGGYIVTSPDGITWALRTSPVSGANLSGVAWNGVTFCAVASRTPDTPWIITSPDGTTWTQQFAPDNGGIHVVNGVIWDGALFVMVGFMVAPSLPASGIMTSADGVLWEFSPPLTRGGTANQLAAAWSGDRHVVVGNTGYIAMGLVS